MFKPIVIMLKSRTSVIWWVNIDAFHFPRILLFQCFQRKQVVTVNEHIATLGVTVTVFWVFNQNARLNRLSLLILPNPRQFKFLQFILCHIC